jgi:hypothetical protein
MRFCGEDAVILLREVQRMNMMDCPRGSAAPEDLTSGSHFLRDCPLDWLSLEYERLRRYCQSLQAARFNVEPFDTVVMAWLGEDVLRHHADEETILVPLLQRLAQSDDDLAPITSRLNRSHLVARAHVQFLLERLARGPRDGGLKFALESDLLTLAAHERQHLSTVSAVLLPLLRLRTEVDELAPLSNALAEGRRFDHIQ